MTGRMKPGHSPGAPDSQVLAQSGSAH